MMSRLRDLRVATKMAIAFATVCVLLLVVVVLALTRLSSSQSRLDAMYTKTQASVSAIGDVRLAAMQLRLSTANVAITDAPEEVVAARAKLAELRGLYEPFAAALAGYLRLEDVTKGYYTTLLRLSAVGVLALVAVGLLVVG